MAEEYERVRSGYPAALVDKACSAAGLAPGDPVVEIGPGTGKLTRELAERGLVVDAVEPDADLAAVARRIVEDAPVRFHIGTFEDVELPPGGRSKPSSRPRATTGSIRMSAGRRPRACSGPTACSRSSGTRAGRGARSTSS